MIVLEAGLWLAWGVLFLGWTIPGVAGIVVSTVRWELDYDAVDMMLLSGIVFVGWVLISSVLHGVMS